jgi:hypothetical protein
MPARQKSKSFGQNGQGATSPRTSVAQQHADWARLLHPDGPFIAVPVLAATFGQGLDTLADGRPI